MRHVASTTRQPAWTRTGEDGAGLPGAGSRRPAVGRHDEIEARRRLAWARYQAAASRDAPSEAEVYLHQHRQLARQRDDYLQVLLELLPFRWHGALEATTGEIRVVLDENLDDGELRRSTGQTLAGDPTLDAARASEHLPTSTDDVRIAERVVVRARTTRVRDRPTCGGRAP